MSTDTKRECSRSEGIEITRAAKTRKNTQSHKQNNNDGKKWARATKNWSKVGTRYPKTDLNLHVYIIALNDCKDERRLRLQLCAHNFVTRIHFVFVNHICRLPKNLGSLNKCCEVHPNHIQITQSRPIKMGACNDEGSEKTQWRQIFLGKFSQSYEIDRKSIEHRWI